jgi:hypothetical protein
LAICEKWSEGRRKDDQQRSDTENCWSAARENIAQIEGGGPTEAGLTEAVAWLARGTSISRETRHHLTGVVGDLFDLIAAEDNDDPETSYRKPK